ncbi:ATP-binding protein [Bifidobacterium sp. ESL0745]|uniref:AAA family ATPase n=1 Tax=Bifidobacterium sp. ESL0745 TaxID=2983226 RepID=UPI0023FA0260|nr:ATP-binding protein [Bifidobacterium sp. ESL0745]MDF7665976.1 AAA family ATPase [Bifidobacterium sp. ESL0745]
MVEHIESPVEISLLKALNPFSPGAGRQPATLVGREHELELMDLLLARTKAKRTSQGIIYRGLRGVGKTVLLIRLQNMAQKMHMPTVRIEATGNDTDDYVELFKGLAKVSRNVVNTKFRQRILNIFENVQSMSVNVLGNGMSVMKSTGDMYGNMPHSNAYQLELLIEEISQAAQDSDLGLFVFIDEFQEMSSELMGTLITLQHRMGQENLPFYIVGVGLPDLPEALTKSRSYAERLFDYRKVGRLSYEDTALGFQNTVAKGGRKFNDEALERLVEDSQGYPYFVQAYGAAAWNQSTISPIPLEAVERGEAEARRSLDEGLYASRWQRATPAGRTYLMAMASMNDREDEENGYATGKIAECMNRDPRELSKMRGKLIELGLIYSPERGKVAFTVPGMADFIRRVKPSAEQIYDKQS